LGINETPADVANKAMGESGKGGKTTAAQRIFNAIE